MQQELPHLQASQGATKAHKKLKAEKNQLVALHTIKASDRDRETTFSPSWSLLTMGLGTLLSQFWLRAMRGYVRCTVLF